MSMTVTYRELFEEGARLLKEAGIEEAEPDARLLLEHVCNTTYGDLYAHGDREVEEEKKRAYEALVKERAGRIPPAYLTGTRSFMGLDFAVDRNVLIPRQDTEILVETVMPHLFSGMRFLDVCTGSGCIAISLLHYSNDTLATATDISEGAAAVAQKNAEALRLSDRIRILCCDLFPPKEEIPEKGFDLICANPPYIAEGVIETLPEEVRVHEPRLALDGGADGLSFYGRLIEGAVRHLCRGGMLFLETGYDQGEAVSRMMKDAGFRHTEIKKDFGGNPRVVYGTLFPG